MSATLASNPYGLDYDPGYALKKAGRYGLGEVVMGLAGLGLGPFFLFNALWQNVLGPFVPSSAMVYLASGWAPCALSGIGACLIYCGLRRFAVSLSQSCQEWGKHYDNGTRWVRLYDLHQNGVLRQHKHDTIMELQGVNSKLRKSNRHMPLRQKEELRERAGELREELDLMRCVVAYAARGSR